MPFVTVHGLPRETSQKDLLSLRGSIIAIVSRKMEVPPESIRPFFPADLLDGPGPDGQTIYVKLDTSMFHGKPKADELAQEVARTLANVVWRELDCRYEVEVFIVGLNPNWSFLREAAA